MKKNLSLRWVALVLALMLMPFSLLAQAEQAEADSSEPTQLFGTQLLDENDDVRSFAFVAGQLHVVTRKQYYRWQPGEEMAKPYPAVRAGHSYTAEEEPRVSLLLTWQDQLLALDTSSGVLYDAQPTDDGLTLKERLALEWEDYVEGIPPHLSVQEPAFANIIGDQLYLRLPNYTNRPVDLYRYDLNTGERVALEAKYLKDIVPYKDGQLVSVLYNENLRSAETGRPLPAAVQLVDPDKGNIEPLTFNLPAEPEVGFPSTPLYYDSTRDALYALNGSALLRLAPDGDPTPVAHLPILLRYGTSAVTPSILPYHDDLVFIAAEGNLFIRSLNESKLAPVVTLKINTMGMDGTALRRTLLQLETIAISPYEGEWLDSAALMTQLLTGEAGFDLLMLRTDEHDVQRMMEKGYLHDLSDSPAVSAFLQDALPMFDKVSKLDGRIYALPLRLDASFIARNEAALKELGQAAPTTVPELMALAQWWTDGGHKEHDTYILFDQSNAKYMLKDIAYSAYKDSLLGQGKPLTFDMERFGALMQAVDALDVSGWDLPPGAGSGDDDDPLEGMGPPLFTPHVGYNIEVARDHMGFPTVLSPGGDMPAFVRARGILLAVPATSKQADDAKRFVEAYVQNLRPVDRAMLSQNWGEPIKNPNYQFELQGLQEDVAFYEDLLSKATGDAEKRQHQQELDSIKRRLETVEKERKYLLTEEGLQQHQDLMSHVYLEDSLSRTANRALESEGYLFGMYVEGAITLEQFIQQANDKIRLMTLEAN